MFFHDHSRSRRGYVGNCARLTRSRLYLGQAEVENLGVAALGDEKVGGLDVAVDNAFAVGRVERIGDFDAQRENRLQFHGAPGDEVLERDAVEELHDEEGAAALLANVVDGADVGMVQRRGGLGLAAKALEGLAILREIVGKKLEGDEAAETRVLGFVDHAHAAATELFDDPVMRDGLIEQRKSPREAVEPC